MYGTRVGEAEEEEINDKQKTRLVDVKEGYRYRKGDASPLQIVKE